MPIAPFPTPAARCGGTGTRLVAEMERGLEAARSRGPLASIGIDTWAVDYGLLDADGELVEAPVSYRDGRTAGYREVVDRIGERRLYEIAGLQLLPINTIFQLAAHDRAALDRARHVVMLPELLAYHLTGEITAELTSAGSTGLLDLATGDWSDELVADVGLRRQLLPEICPPGTPVGDWHGVPVHLVGGHDTASAVLGGGAEGAAFVSAGTWLLVGRLLDRPDTSEDSPTRSLHERAGRGRRHPLPAQRRRLVARRGVPAGVGRPRSRRPPRRGGDGRAGARPSTPPTSASSARRTCRPS